MGMMGRSFSVLFLVAAAALQLSFAAIYKVGDSAGWTTLGNIDYKKWASSKTFHVGDTILFVYHVQVHNVMIVSQAAYETCNVSNPLATYTTGNDSYTIKTFGHHYFLCGVPGHCQVGQKVDINVVSLASLAPSPQAAAPSPPASSTPSPVGAAGASAPPPSDSPPNALMGLLWKSGIAMSVFAAFVSAYA